MKNFLASLQRARRMHPSAHAGRRLNPGEPNQTNALSVPRSVELRIHSGRAPLNTMKKPTKRSILQIFVLPDGAFESHVHLYNGVSTIGFSIALASATRVFAQALADAMQLGEEHIEQIEAQVVEHYNLDVNKFGSMGEKAERQDDEK